MDAYDAAHAAATTTYEAAREAAYTTAFPAGYPDDENYQQYAALISAADTNYMAAMNTAYREREAARAAAIDAPLASWCAHDDTLVWGFGTTPQEALQNVADESDYEGDVDELETDEMAPAMAERIARGVDVRWLGGEE